jgi:hypothetical protein
MPTTTFPATPGIARPGRINPGFPGAGVPGGGPPPPPSGIVNQWAATSVNDHGLVVVPIPGYTGQGLIAFIGWNDASYPMTGVAFVADDAHDFWVPLETSNTLGPGHQIRGAMWITTPQANPNPQLATCVSVSVNFPVSSIAIAIVEITGLPFLAQQGFVPVAGGSIGVAATTLTVNPVNPVWAFGVGVADNNLNTVTAPGAPWTVLNQVSANDPGGAGGAADVKIVPVFAQVNAGSLSASWTPSAGLGMVAAVGGILQTPAAVGSSNPNWPVFQVGAAFGAQPGNPINPLSYTDLSSRAISPDGQSILDTTRGRSYELTGPEAGTTTVWLNNSDGGLTPGNTGSPYSPNVLPETPIQVSAIWNNQQYAVASVNVDKWPQSFGADTPQFGMTNMSGSDSMGTLANTTMYSAYSSEVLLDNPYSYWPLSESYGAANGLPFDNLGSSIANTKPMVGFDSQSLGGTALATGQTMNLQGDTNGGIGLSGLTAGIPTWGAGAICIDPALPQLGNGFLLSIDFWAMVPNLAPTVPGNFTIPLVSLLGPPTNFGSGGGPIRFQVSAVSGAPHQSQVTIADYAGNIFTTTAFSMPGDGLVHHHAFTINSPLWTITHYVDGVMDTSVFHSSGSVALPTDVYQVVVGPTLITPVAAAPYNYAIAHVAIYPQVLTLSRVLAHYKAGALGYAGDDAVTRFKRIMAWAQSGLPLASTPPSPTPLMGAAYSLQGQAVTDSLNDLLTSEGGWPYADAAGNTWWLARTYLYNKSPKWVFGDNPANGEIPYNADQSFDFDNAFLYTQVQVTRNIGQSSQVTTSPSQGVNALTFQNTGAILRVASAAAQNAYRNRNALSQTILTSSDQDAYDRAFWSLNKYSAAYLRVPQIVVDAASNPSLWPVVLGAEVGDIVRVIRRPLGGAPYSILGIIVQVQVEVNVASETGRGTFGIVPYNIESNVIQVDNADFNTLQSTIGW